MTDATQPEGDFQELRQRLVAQEAVIASLATRLILDAPDKHRMLESVFTEALEQLDRALPSGSEREGARERIHELADRVQHGE